MNEEILRLKKRKQELEKAVEFTKQSKKKVIEIVQKLASKLGSKLITRQQYEEELKKALKNRTAEQWIKYYEDYIDYYNYQIKLCNNLIKQEQLNRIKETARKKAVPVLKIGIVIAAIALIFTFVFILKPVGIGVFEKIGEKVSVSIESLTEKAPAAEEKLEIIEALPVFEEPKVPVILEDKKVLIKEESLTQYQAVVGKNVRWKKQFKINEITGFSVELPKGSENIKVKTIENGKEKDVTEIADIKKKKSFFIFEKNVEVEIKEQNVAGITGNAVDEQNQEEREFEIYYETSAPEIFELETEGKAIKKVLIKGHDNIHYKNVLSFTKLPREFSRNEIGRLKLYEIKNNKRIRTEFITYDTDENGLYDYAEWLTPELSEAVFEFIIEISKAEHLDSEKNFISDIYEQVYKLDNIWSEPINNNEYVRVTFFKKLDSTRDITIYPRIIQGQPRIEVYEINSSEKIAEFTNLQNNQYNKVFLTKLKEEQDVFDLRIVGGSMEIEHIVDPSGPPNINFTYPTPSDNEIINVDNFFVNVSSSDENEHYTFLDFNKDLVLWMRMDDVNQTGIGALVYDNSSYENNGTAVGNAVQYPSGKFGKSFSFDGNGDYINISDISGFGEGMSVAGWVRFNDVSVNRGLIASDREFHLWAVYDKKGTKFSAGIYNPTNYWSEIISTTIVSTGIWYHVVLSYDGSRFKLYVNGNQEGLTTQYSLVDSTNPITIGAQRGIVNMDHSGYIDDAVIFKRALNDQEIKALYNAGVSLNKYFRNFTELQEGNYSVKAYSADALGKINKTEERNITIALSFNFPDIIFVLPTLDNNSMQSRNSTFVNVSASDTNSPAQNISTFIDFDNSLVGWWRMDDLNSSGGIIDYIRRNNGSNFGGVLTNGYLGKSLNFDSDEDKISLDKKLQLTGEFSISFWGYKNSYLANGIMGPNSISDGRIALMGSSRDVIAINSNTAGSYVYVTSLFPLSEWFHTIITRNSSNSINIYKNGLFVTDTAACAAAPDRCIVPGIITIERIGDVSEDSTWYSFRGKMDDVIIFNRSLSLQEIRGLYANQTSRYLEVNYTNLSVGNYNFRAYSQNTKGKVNMTDERSVSVNKNFVDQCKIFNEADTIYIQTANIENNDLTGPCINITALNITLDCKGYSITSDDPQIMIYSDQPNTTIKNCNINVSRTVNGKGIYLYKANNSYIYNNTIVQSYSGIDVYSDNSIIERNIVNYSVSSCIVVGGGGDNITVINNSVSKCGKGINIYNTKSTKLLNNFILDCTNGIAIISSVAENNLFEGNVIKSCDYGINLQSAINNVFKDMNISGSSDYDVYSVSPANNNTFLNVSYALSKEYVEAGSELIRKWYYQANVTDTNSIPIINANLSAYNKTGIPRGWMFNLTSNSTGFTNITTITDYINNGTRNYYSLYTINTRNGSLSESHSLNVTERTLQPGFGGLILDNIVFDAIPPSISFVPPTPPNGSAQYNNNIFVNVSASDVGRGDNNISTFIDFDNSLVGWWRMDDVGGWCYQETANVATACGGESTGSYAAVPYYVYINYTKPVGASPRSLWQVKHGRLSSYNVTIPLDCWNYDSNKLVLRVKASASLSLGKESYGECKYNSGADDWKRITELTSFSGGFGHSDGSYINIIDGNWNTKAFYVGATTNDWKVCAGGSGAECEHADFYEEAMNWFVEGTGNSVADMSEYANTGTAFGNALQTDAGKFGKGFSFDGNGDYIELPASNKILTQNETFTFSLWFNANEFVVIPGDYLIAIRGPGGIGAAIFTEESGGNKRVQWQYATDPTSTIGSLIKDNLETNKWYHVAFTYNETAAVSYYNGQRTYSLENPPQFFGFDLSTGIIGALASNSRFFNGTIDDVMIFNRSLSEEEIRGLYANTSTKYVSNNFTNLSEGSHTFKAYTQDTFGNVNSTEKREVNVVSVPKIVWVQNISEITPLPGEIKAIDIKFTAYYGGGYANLNDSSAKVNFIKEGILREGTCSRIVSESFGNYANYSCNIGMWYYDEGGSWDINASIADNNGNFGINNSNSFFYKFLYSFEMVPNYVNWSNVEIGSIDRPADNNITIRNFGNTNIINASVNGTNLSGKTYPQYQISAANFSFSNSSFNPCSGSRLKENENVSVSLFINYSNSFNYDFANNTLGFCLKGFPAGVIAQEYETESGKHWDINVVFGFFISMKYAFFAVAIVIKKRKSKKKYLLNQEELLSLDKKLKEKYGTNIRELLGAVKEERIKKEIQVPADIFKGKISPAEALCKYLKENNKLEFNEIAELINRDNRTVWINYRNAAKKKKSRIKTEKKLLVPINIFSNRKLSILESIINYLKEKGFRNYEIAELLGKDQRNIYTLYNRAKKKLR